MDCDNERIKRLERDLTELARRRRMYDEPGWSPAFREQSLKDIARSMAAKEGRLRELKLKLERQAAEP